MPKPEDRFAAFEALNIASGDYIICPACFHIGILIDVDHEESAGLLCEMCDTPFQYDDRD